jgi:acyl phosphate:glycerol-3-phosphate acyltransferase
MAATRAVLARQARPGRGLATGRLVGSAALCLAAYLYGSLPYVYLLGRRRRVDLKEVGSGNVGATNLWLVGGARPAVLGWLLDASKGLLPVLVGRRLGLPDTASALAGACGTAGQCWPVWLGFSGGRGISAFVGAALAIDPACWLAALVPFVVGSSWRVVPLLGSRSTPLAGRLRAGRSRSVPLGSLLGVLAFPVVSWLTGRGPLLPRLVLALVIAARRLTAPLPDDVVEGPSEEPHALVYRLLYDRNTAT